MFYPRQVENTEPKDISWAGELIGYIAAWTVLSTLAIILRSWVRTVITKQGIGWDDGLMIVCGVLNIAYSVLLGLTTIYGNGRHIIYVPPEDIEPLLKITFATSPIYLTLIWALKTSLILFYLRLSQSEYFHAWCWGYICFNSVLYVSFLTTTTVQCKPVSFFWDKSIPGGHCAALKKVYVAIACLALFMDIVALLLPAWPVFHLNMSMKKRLQLAVMFSSGFMVCIASVFRMFAIAALGNGASLDLTWALKRSYIWTITELNLGIITICGPISKHFFTHYFSESRSDNSSRRFSARRKFRGKLGNATFTITTTDKGGNSVQMSAFRDQPDDQVPERPLESQNRDSDASSATTSMRPLHAMESASEHPGHSWGRDAMV